MASAIQNLCDAIAQNTSYDQGAKDSTVFLIESGVLSVHLAGSKGQMQLAILSPGSVVGEGAFFSRLPRSANVAAIADAWIWRLTPGRFTELANRQPTLALEVVQALGSVIAKRMVDRLKRIAVT